MQAAPNCVASRVPFHFDAGSGGFQRSAPIGGCAYGMPLKTCTLADGFALQLAGGRVDHGRSVGGRRHGQEQRG